MFSCAVGRDEHCKQISLACVGSALNVLTIRFAPAHGVCAFLVYTAQAPCCSAGELSKVGLGCMHIPGLSHSRFRFSGTPQRCILGWACVLCPFQFQAAQATRCLVSTLSPDGAVCLITSPIPAAWFPGFLVKALSQVCCVSPLGS